MAKDKPRALCCNGAMFESVVIANRGEIACRIARTAKRMGLRTIAVYSDADAGALMCAHVRRGHPIGPAPASQSYLSIERLIAAARRAGADCIHPGYGFLAGKRRLRRGVSPPRASSSSARADGDAGHGRQGPRQGAHGEGRRSGAARLSRRAPGAVTFLRQKAYEIGYPVMIKAIAGGGGQGLRRVDRSRRFRGRPGRLPAGGAASPSRTNGC